MIRKEKKAKNRRLNFFFVFKKNTTLIQSLFNLNPLHPTKIAALCRILVSSARFFPIFFGPVSRTMRLIKTVGSLTIDDEFKLRRGLSGYFFCAFILFSVLFSLLVLFCVLSFLQVQEL